MSVLVKPASDIRLVRDMDDDEVVCVAIGGGATRVVTRDDDLKWAPEVVTALKERGIEVVSVSQFLVLLEGHEPPGASPPT